MTFCPDVLCLYRQHALERSWLYHFYRIWSCRKMVHILTGSSDTIWMLHYKDVQISWINMIDSSDNYVWIIEHQNIISFLRKIDRNHKTSTQERLQATVLLCKNSMFSGINRIQKDSFVDMIQINDPSSHSGRFSRVYHASLRILVWLKDQYVFPRFKHETFAK